MPCNCRKGTGLHDHLGDAAIRDGLFGVGIPLNGYIDLTSIQIWNSKQTASEAKCLFDPSTESNNNPVCSDDDPEMLIHVMFAEVCRVKAVTVLGPFNDYAPSQVKIFNNPPEVHGFDSVRRLRPQEEIQLACTSGEDRIAYRLNASKFSSVSSLALHFEHSFNDVECHLLRIEVYGESLGRPTQQQVAMNLVYEGRANPADHPSLFEEKASLFQVQ